MQSTIHNPLDIVHKKEVNPVEYQYYNSMHFHLSGKNFKELTVEKYIYQHTRAFAKDSKSKKGILENTKRNSTQTHTAHTILSCFRFESFYRIFISSGLLLRLFAFIVSFFSFVCNFLQPMCADDKFCIYTLYVSPYI